MFAVNVQSGSFYRFTLRLDDDLHHVTDNNICNWIAMNEWMYECTHTISGDPIYSFSLPFAFALCAYECIKTFARTNLTHLKWIQLNNST